MITIKVEQKELFEMLSRYGFLFEQSIPLRGIHFMAPITSLAANQFHLFHAVRYGIGF